MPAFAVSIVDRSGHRRTLRERAADAAEVRERLRARAVWPLEIRPVASSARLARTTIPVREFLALLHQFELQLRAGVTADAALRQLAEDAPSLRARIILEQVSEEVAQGKPIHAACRFFHRQFPAHVAAVIAAGETAAQLPSAVCALAEHLSNVEALRRTARRAIAYPSLVLIATSSLIVFMLGGVVPQFAAIFSSLHLSLPWPTLALIAASKVAGSSWAWLLGMGVALVLVHLVARRTESGQRFRDAMLLRVPILGDTLRHLATARFAAHVRLLHEAGVPVLDSLATGAELTANRILARDVMAARAGVAEGKALYAALPARHAFPRFVVPALKSGESTGQLGPALRHIETYAAGYAQERLGLAIALLEPALIAFLTAVVGFIALSFFLPIFQLMGGIR